MSANADKTLTAADPSQNPLEDHLSSLETLLIPPELAIEGDDQAIFVLEADLTPADVAKDEYKSSYDLFFTDVYKFEPKQPRPQSAQPPTGKSPASRRPGVVYKQKYKKVANRVKPAMTAFPPEYRVVRNITGDPLEGMPVLPTNPLAFTPGERYTQERYEAQEIADIGFLWPEERLLTHHFLKLQEKGFAWTEAEKGCFRTDFFPPAHMPVIPHTPWRYKNIPIPPGILDDVVKIIKDKIASGVYEPSNSSYRSRWFCVIKADGKSMRIVHDLQPLNGVSIRDVAVPPLSEQLVESFGGHSIYTTLDIFVGYDERLLHPDSRDYTSFQTPLGTFRLTHIPMGYTNSLQIFHGDVTYTLQDEVPHVTIPFVDDVPIKGPPTRYESDDGSFETIPQNSGIRRFVWEHLQDVNRIVQRIKYIGGTFSGKKLFLCVPDAIVLGCKCAFEGRLPDDSKVQKIRDWPIPERLTDVRGFLGLCGVLWVFVKDYARHASPLVRLTRKDVPFEFADAQLSAFDYLKEAIINSPALLPINYKEDWEVILAVDSSYIAVGFLLSQERADKRRYPNRFGSITFNERESRYSQPKLELYGLFRALKSVRVFIIGARKLIVEVDAKFIKGMLNNPDMQPNATINRWIAGVLLFNFELRHVSASAHTGPDGLSRRPAALEDPEEPDDHEEWLDCSYGFLMELLNYRPLPHASAPPLACFVSSGISAPTHVDPTLSVNVLEDVQEIIPRTAKAEKADERVSAVEGFLRTLKRPADLTDDAYKHFLRYVGEFFLKGERLWRRDRHGKHKIVVPQRKRFALIREAHDALGHKGMFSVRTRILDRFWWPFLDHDIKWYVQSCHQCQVRKMRYHHIPPSVPTPFSLFRKVYMDTMFMPRAGGFRYIVQARCSLSSYPEWRQLRRETGTTIGAFIFEDILCRWGAVEEIVTDNGPAFVSALEYLAKQYRIHHIKISPFNSAANGPVERRHLDVREAIMKTCEGDESRWSSVTHTVFWAERVTTHRALGYSSYYIAHGVEPLFPFDLAEATYMVPPQDVMSTTELIALRARQLQKREADLEMIKLRVLKSRYESIRQFEKQFRNTITDLVFDEGALVLVRNSKIESALDRKTKQRWFGPMIVIRRTKGGSYILVELDGSVSRLRYAAFRVAPYHPRSYITRPLHTTIEHNDDDVDKMIGDDPSAPNDDESEDADDQSA